MMVSDMVGKKRGRGRKKIEMKKIEEKSSRQITFAKRRLGLFNKATELCILTGAQVAILVKPESNRVLSFSHPPNDAVINRFLTGVHDPSRDDNCETLIKDFGEKYSDICAEVEKARIAEQNAAAVGAGTTAWWEKSEEGMGVEELEEFREALRELILNVDVRANEADFLGRSKGFGSAAVPNPKVEAAPSSSSGVPSLMYMNQMGVPSFNHQNSGF